MLGLKLTKKISPTEQQQLEQLQVKIYGNILTNKPEWYAIATYNKQLIGIVAYTKENQLVKKPEGNQFDSDTDAFLVLFMVDPKHREKGIGNLLLDAIQWKAKKNDITQLHGLTWGTDGYDLPAHILKKQGFTTYVEFPEFWEEGLEENYNCHSCNGKYTCHATWMTKDI